MAGSGVSVTERLWQGSFGSTDSEVFVRVCACSALCCCLMLVFLFFFFPFFCCQHTVKCKSSKKRATCLIGILQRCDDMTDMTCVFSALLDFGFPGCGTSEFNSDSTFDLTCP